MTFDFWIESEIIIKKHEGKKKKEMIAFHYVMRTELGVCILM